MNRRILFIILGAIIFAVLVGMAWLWFFGSEQPVQGPSGNGFGTSQDRQTTGGSPKTQSGGSSNVVSGGTSGRTTSQGGVSGISGGSGVSGTSGTASGVSGMSGISGVSGTSGGSGVSGGSSVAVGGSVQGVTWLATGGDASSGSGATGRGPATTNFVPSTANQLNTDTISGSPNILPGSSNTNNGSNSALNSALIGVGVGLAACTAGLTPGALAGAATVAATEVANVPVRTTSLTIIGTSQEFRENFLNCVARSIARTAIQQITNSVVNWINSGFNGKPSFVTNYEQFFTNVADKAAGEFIKGSALSFLCSPFRDQIRISLAQSYARRNNDAGACSLSGIIKNQQSFMNGNFSSGGWGGLIAFTTHPVNNAFGADAYANDLLRVTVTNAKNKEATRITPSGFLSTVEEYDCYVVPKSQGEGPSQEKKCKTRIKTPGSVIESSLSKTLGTSLDSLNLAKNFDEIISALITQLMTKTLYSGLNNLSGTQGYAGNYLTPEQQQALTTAQGLMVDMQARVQYAQQYGQVEQGSIADLQTTVKGLQNLVTCWETASSSPNFVEHPDKQKEAQTNAIAALATERSYEARLDAYNLNITKANEGIALLQSFQTRTLAITSANEVSGVSAEYQQALASGRVLTETDVVSAQQDRTALQSELTSRNQQTATELKQCNAF